MRRNMNWISGGTSYYFLEQLRSSWLWNNNSGEQRIYRFMIIIYEMTCSSLTIGLSFIQLNSNICRNSSKRKNTRRFTREWIKTIIRCVTRNSVSINWSTIWV